MPRLRDALTHFIVLAQQGLIPDRRTGGHSRPSTQRLQVFEANVLRGFESLTGRSDDALLDTEIGTLISDIDARLAAVPNAKRNTLNPRVWHNQVSDVRLLVTVLQGRDVDKRFEVRLDLFPEAWLPLAAALEADAVAWAEATAVNVAVADPQHGRRARRSDLCELLVFAQLCAEHGVVLPTDLPANGAEILAWSPAPTEIARAPDRLSDTASESDRTAYDEQLTAYEIHRGVLRAARRLKSGLSAYRHARRLLGDPTLPLALVEDPARQRNLRSLADLDARLSAARHPLAADVHARLIATYGTIDLPANDMCMADIIRVLAPKIGRRLQMYLDAKEHVKAQPQTLEHVVGSVSRILKVLLDLGVDVAALDMFDLWEPTAPASATVVTAPSEAPDYLEDFPDDLATPGASLMRRAIELSAPLSLAQSPMSAACLHEDEVELYTASLFSDLLACRGVLVVSANADIKASRHKKAAIKKRLARVDQEYKALTADMRALNAERRTIQQGLRDNALIPVTWSQIVTIGLPHLRQQVLTAERALRDFEQAGNRVGNWRWTRLRNAFFRCYEITVSPR